MIRPTLSTRDGAAALLWNAAAALPDAPAFAGTPEVASYGELLRRASAYARALRAAAVRPGDRVALLLERGPEAAAAWFGTLAAGGVGVFVNEVLRRPQIEHILDDSGATALIASPVLLRRFPAGLRRPATVLAPSAIREAGEWAPVDRDASAPAHIAYTSGSTGPPKGVVLTHGNLLASAAAVSGYLGLRPDDRTASLLPFSSVYGLNQLLCAVATGGALVVETSPLASSVVRTLGETATTVLAAVPPLWLQLLQLPAFGETPLPALRVLQNAGGHLPRAAVARLRRAQPHAALFLMYGMTEMMRSTYLAPDEVDRRPGSIGRAIPGGTVRVLRADGEECAPGEVGELVHEGPTVALGYWRRPAATARTFRPAPGGGRRVHSGDLVRRDEEGFLYFVGRRDGMIKTMGYRVGPDEIVEVLLASGEVAEAAVVAEQDGARGQRIVAHVALHPGGSEAPLRDHCRRELPRHMLPARVELHPALPRTPSGKYDLEALRHAAV